jgi:hypothetical protein
VTDIVQELRRDIWLPFVEAYANRDVAAFGGLHDPGLIRAEGASGWAGGFDGYVERVGAFFADMTAKGADLRIAFRFAEHVTSGEVASEQGVYQIVMAVPGEKERTFYGRFHTFARKNGGRWRIVVDYDTDRDVEEADFYGAEHE